jgi:hypothetical protein
MINDDPLAVGTGETHTRHIRSHAWGVADSGTTVPQALGLGTDRLPGCRIQTVQLMPLERGARVPFKTTTVTQQKVLV